MKCIHLVRVHCHAGVLIDSQFEYLCGVFEFRAPECINLSIQALSYDVFWRENVAKTELKPAVKFASLDYPDGPYINSQYTQQEFLATGLTLPGEQGGAGCCRWALGHQIRFGFSSIMTWGYLQGLQLMGPGVEFIIIGLGLGGWGVVSPAPLNLLKIYIRPHKNHIFCCDFGLIFRPKIHLCHFLMKGEIFIWNLEQFTW